MAIGSDTEIKQYQVQKRFSLADIITAHLGALGSLPFPAIYMPLRDIARAKGTLKVCESDVKHLGRHRRDMTGSLDCGELGYCDDLGCKRIFSAFARGGGGCGEFTWKPRGDCLVPRLRIMVQLKESGLM